jgi:pyruvate/2-oxoglutarate dehydrogenase complex dihydrolipoamide acyltransferase (E2) component
MRDFLHFAMKVPTAGGSAVVDVSDVATARRLCPPLISWTAIFVKAIALTSKKQPELRQYYMPLPWPHIYEHPHCIAGVVVEREWRCEDAVLIGLIGEPEKKSLREIDTRIRFMKRAKVEALGSFRRLIRNTAYPLPFRRLLWRITLFGSGRLRAATCGTFWVNSIRARDVQVTQSFALVALSCFLTPVKPNGGMTLQVFFDHRVIDGVTVKRVVNEIEATLNGPILAELRGQSSRQEQRDGGQGQAQRA